MDEHSIREFWQAHPCGDTLVDESVDQRQLTESFFDAYDNHRYSTESHILECLDDVGFAGKTVLEIGLGQGADSEQIIRRGGTWSGLDLTHESVVRVRNRLQSRQLPYSALKQGSVLSLPFDDDSFDIVYSHGVLHHVPEIEKAQEEIHRVLRPGGKLVVMLYARWSFNYMVSISIVRRLGLLALWIANRAPNELISQHLANARAQGICSYLKMDNFIHSNTDGPLNPYSKVYDRALVEKDFSNFQVQKVFKRFMHAPPLPIGALPLEKQLGWHLWAHLSPRS